MALIGKAIMWPADNLPANALELDGSTVETALYPLLHLAYGRIYTPPNTPSHLFCLPDARGRIFRGVDMASGHDPEAITIIRDGLYFSFGRNDRGDGTIDDAVGTTQDDAHIVHRHFAYGNAGNAADTGMHINDNTNYHLDGANNDRVTGTVSAPDLATETRGDNIALTMIVFYQ